MLRRDFVRAVVVAGVAPHALLSQQAGKPELPAPAPVPWLLGLTAKTPLPHTQPAEVVAEPKLAFFTAAQLAILSRLSDVLMPPVGDKPGALQAETPQFLDFLIATSPASTQKMYTAGLAWLNEESLRKYKANFATLDDAKVDAIIKPWLRTWMSDHPPAETHADFINIAHADIRDATINSKQWSAVPSARTQPKTEVALYWTPIEPAINHVQPHVAAHLNSISSTGQKMPQYSR